MAVGVGRAFYICSHLDQLAGGGGEKERFQTTPHISRSANREVRMPLAQIDINKLKEGGGFCKKYLYYEIVHKYIKE